MVRAGTARYSGNGVWAMSRLVPSGGRVNPDHYPQVAVDGRPIDESCRRCGKQVYRLDDHDRCLGGHKQRDHPTHDI